METLIKAIKEEYFSNFNKEPAIIFSPGRINLIGEHTDYNDGFVLPNSINKGIYLAIEKSDTDYCTIISHDLKESFNFSLNAIKTFEKGSWKNYIVGVVAETLKIRDNIESFNVVFGGTIPIGAGLSSSAALENAVAFGLNYLFKLSIPKKQLIKISQAAEHNFAGVNCGIMDQFASMFGVKNGALLLDCRSLESDSINFKLNNFELLLINTNVEHSLNNSAYNNRRESCERVSKTLQINALRDATMEMLENSKTEISSDDFKKATYVIEENQRVLKAVNTLKNNELLEFGKLLYKSHEGLKNLYEVSCEELDFLVDEGRKFKGNIGARMVGGGFGGCTLHLIEKQVVDDFKNHIHQAYLTKFNKECTFYSFSFSEGTHLI